MSFMNGFTIVYYPISNTLVFTNPIYDFTFLSSSTCLSLLGFNGSSSSSSKKLISNCAVNLMPINCTCINSNLSIAFGIGNQSTHTTHAIGHKSHNAHNHQPNTTIKGLSDVIQNFSNHFFGSKISEHFVSLIK